jgi:transcription elongation factor Elf1
MNLIQLYLMAYFHHQYQHNDWILAYSLIKNSAVQMERLNNKELLYFTNLNRHKMTSHDTSSGVRGPKSTRYTCPICGLITVSMERLQKHVNQHGQILHLETYRSERKISSLSCEKCKATFSSPYALRKHQRVHTRGLF